MASSYEKIVGEQVRDKVMFWLSVAMLIVLSVVVIAMALSSPNRNKIVASYGLILDFFGVLLASYTIVFPLKKKAQPGMQFQSNHPKFRPQALAEYEEKHGIKLQIGILLIALGFIIQLAGNWL